MRNSPALLLLAWTAGSFCWTSSAPGAQRPVSERRATEPKRSLEAAPGHIVVRFRKGTDRNAVEALTSAHGARTIKRQPHSRLERISLPRGADLSSVLEAYRSHPLVEEAGLNFIAYALDHPSDPDYLSQWHLHSIEGGMGADSAWRLATNVGAGAIVAVIDSGVAYEDYASTEGGATRTFKRAPDLSGTEFVAPWDFSGNDPHANDDNGHGTHVAGTIAQTTHNGYGAAGVAYEASLMPLKVLDAAGSGFADDLVESIYHAVHNGARVINMSLGFPDTGTSTGGQAPCSEILGLNEALQFAHDNGVTVVAAAGNDGGNVVLCPAAYPTVIAVGATRFDGTVSFYSNRGQALDIVAPGGDPNVDQNADGVGDGVLQETFCYDWWILSLLGGYDQFCRRFLSGTSMATPHVAGAAALLLGEVPSLTPDSVRLHLQSTARDLGPSGWDEEYGWGLLDASAAVADLLGVPPPPPVEVAAPTDLTGVAVSSNRIDLRWTDNSDDEAAFKIERSTEGGSFAQIAVIDANVTAYSDTHLAAGTAYSYRVRAFEGPNPSAYSNVATITTLPPPAAPSDLTATAISSSRIELTWTDNADNEAGFKVERSTDGVNFTQIALRSANVTTYSNTFLTASTTYYYRVRSYEGQNHSDYSDTASAKTGPPPAAPSDLTATAVSSSRIELSWTDNADDEAGFKLERSTDGVHFAQIAFLRANTTSYSNAFLTASTTYQYRIRAYEGPNQSGYSNTASAETGPPPAAPSHLAATAVSSSRIDLSWTDHANDEAGFKVERSTDGVSFLQIASLGANATGFASSSLNAGTTYHYRVRAYEGPNHSEYSNMASARTDGPPAAPSNLTATAVSSSRIDLSWQDNSSGESGFRLERSADGVSFTLLTYLGANVTSYSNSYLSAGTTFFYRVAAYDGSNQSDFSNVASATTTAPPAAPSSLAAAAVSPSRIDLSWSDNSTNEAGFKVERSTDGVTFQQIATVAANVTGYTSSFLTADTTYFYRVAAYEGSNLSAYSNVASAKTQAPPAAPSGLTATAASPSRIDLSWTDHSDNEAGFKLERSSDGTNFSQIAYLGANVTSYSNTYLTAATTYHYRVRAYEGSHHSEYSNLASATTQSLLAPSNLAATAVSPSRIVLTWTDNASNEAGYKLERSSDGVNFSQVTSMAANSTSYTNSFLAASTTYFYRVRAYEGSNHSGYSNVASATTQDLLGPSNLSATALSPSRIVLTWTDNASNEAGYKLERSADGVAFSQIAYVAANATSYSNTYLAASTTYFYRLRAYESSNHSDYSNVASATTEDLLAPSNLTATAISSSRVELSWLDNADNEAGYKVERSTDGIHFTQIAFLGKNVTSYASTGLSAGATYYYRVRAYEGPNHSAYSNVAAASTP